MASLQSRLYKLANAFFFLHQFGISSSVPLHGSIGFSQAFPIKALNTIKEMPLNNGSDNH